MMKVAAMTLLISWISNGFSQSPEIEWQKNSGGSSQDEAYSVIQTLDGGFIAAGGSWSNDGDVFINHGSEDYWLIKYDINGNIEWQKTYGGTGIEKAFCIDQTIDGGYIVAGSSTSSNGDLTFNHGLDDYWILKINAIGSIEWQTSLGGSGSDEARSIQQTTDGGYIVVGTSSSNNGDIAGNHGGP